MILLINLTVEQFKESHQKKFIVYNIPKVSAMDFISGKNNVFITDTIFAKDDKRLLYHVKHNWWDSGINETKITSTDIETNNLTIINNYIQFYTKRIVVINNQYNTKHLGILDLQPIIIDYLIISKNPKIKMENILKLYSPKMIVFDSSNSFYRLKKWKQECVILNQEYYSVNESGALVVNM